MELLTIQHQDFLMTIECHNFDGIWRKALNNIGEQGVYSVYSWTSDYCEVYVKNNTSKNMEVVKNGESHPAIFFDNTDYNIWIEFKEHINFAQFTLNLQKDNENFTYRKNILTGYINYGNDIGKSEISFQYKTKESFKSFTFSFDVLSSKLDYHKDWRRILEDIESEYRMLSLDFLKRTFHGFSLDIKGDTPEIIWWSVFSKEQNKFIQACKNIIDSPRSRLHGQDSFKRIDELPIVPHYLENEFSEYRHDYGHLYRVKIQSKSNDTQENRFIKYALEKIISKYNSLLQKIIQFNSISDVKKQELKANLSRMIRLQRNPFFRTIGKYKGLTQESLVLQKASYYSQVYRTWNILKRGYSLYDGFYRLQTKNIATLYEIWCFIVVSHIVKEKLNLSDDDIDHRNRMELNSFFCYELGHGERSRIIFKKDNVELAELIYNPKNSFYDNNSLGIKDLVVRTVPQKPDIVLQLTKNDLQKGMKLTYLFDAKYRISYRENGIDYPPEDAINQMHRYRDAIYYKEHDTYKLKKEVIGGYILFPGNGKTNDIEISNFFKSISEVNIGAFPLRPRQIDNYKLLENFIASVIKRKANETILSVISQKGTFTGVGNRVLIGFISKNDFNNNAKVFLDGVATFYNTDNNFPSSIELKDLHYFMPYVDGIGLKDVYEITGIRANNFFEATDIQESKTDIGITFELKFVRNEFSEYKQIKTEKMMKGYFIDTFFEKLGNYILW